MSKRWPWVALALVAVIVGTLWYMRESDDRIPGRIEEISVPIPGNWQIYEGDGWSIRHPAGLIPKTATSSPAALVTFEGADKNIRYSVNVQPLSADNGALAKIRKTDPGREHVVADLVRIEDESLETQAAISHVDAHEVTVAGVPAVRAAWTYSSSTQPSAHIEQTAFVKSDGTEGLITLVVTGATAPQSDTQAIYDALVSSFRFK